MDRNRQWDINFSIDVLHKSLKNIQIIPCGGRGRKLNISRGCLILPNLHKHVIRRCNINHRYKNGEVQSQIGKKLSEVFSQDIMDFSKNTERIVKEGKHIDKKLQSSQSKDCNSSKIKSEVDVSSHLISSVLEEATVHNNVDSEINICESIQPSVSLPMSENYTCSSPLSFAIPKAITYKPSDSKINITKSKPKNQKTKPKVNILPSSISSVAGDDDDKQYLDSKMDKSKWKNSFTKSESKSTQSDIDIFTSLTQSVPKKVKVDEAVHSNDNIHIISNAISTSSEIDITSSLILSVDKAQCETKIYNDVGKGKEGMVPSTMSEIDMSLNINLNTDEEKINNCELPDSTVSIDESKDNNTVSIKLEIPSSTSIKEDLAGSKHTDDKTKRKKDKKRNALSTKSNNDTPPCFSSTEEVKVNKHADTKFDKQLDEVNNTKKSKKNNTLSTKSGIDSSSSLTSVLEKVDDPSEHTVSKKNNCPATKSEIDMSSNLLSSHVEALIKEKKIGSTGSPNSIVLNNSASQLKGITSCTERDRKEIESNIIEISNNLQNTQDCKKDNLSMQVNKSKNITEKGKQNALNTEILTTDNLFPRPMSTEEIEKRNYDMNHNLFPQVTDPSTLLCTQDIVSFDVMPDFVNTLEVQDVVINDTKPAKFSLRNSLITPSNVETKINTYNNQHNVQASVSNTLPAIPMSMTIADPTNIRGIRYFNDPRYLITLEDKELFVVIEHIPVNVVKELEEQIASFGTVVFFVTEFIFDESERIGLLKMSDSFECDFVVSCLDGYVWGELRMVVRKALDIL